MNANTSHAFNVDQHIAARSTRLAVYVAVMGITFAALTTTLFFVLAYAGAATTLAKLAVAVSIISATTFGALAGNSALDELTAINGEFVEAAPGSRYAKYLAELPMPLFRALTVTLISLSGLVQLIALFGA